jgi:hypothetical protein
MINLELRRAIYKAFGLRPDGLQRLIIDISHDGHPTVYAQVVSTGGTVEEVIDAVHFTGFEVRKVNILDAIPEVSTEEFIGGTPMGTLVINPDGCTNNEPCPVMDLHLHTNGS